MPCIASSRTAGEHTFETGIEKKRRDCHRVHDVVERQCSMSTSQHDLEIASEHNPPPQPVRKDKKWRPHPRPRAQTKRGPPRPYRRIPVETLNTRIAKLTARIDRARKQHEETRTLLIKYVHERAYRTKEALEQTTSGNTHEKDQPAQKPAQDSVPADSLEGVPPPLDPIP